MAAPIKLGIRDIQLKAPDQPMYLSPCSVIHWKLSWLRLLTLLILKEYAITTQGPDSQRFIDAFLKYTDLAQIGVVEVVY